MLNCNFSYLSIVTIFQPRIVGPHNPSIKRTLMEKTVKVENCKILKLPLKQHIMKIFVNVRLANSEHAEVSVCFLSSFYLLFSNIILV